MAGMLQGEMSHHGMSEGESCSYVQDRLEECDKYGSSWYLSRKEIEENSPSRQDGIDLKKEAYLRKSYCTFLQDLGMRLKVPQVTIATAIIFCHRFFLRQSHAKNDRRMVATVCMFLAGKVEETPRPLKDVILVSYEIIHKKDPAAIQRIKQKEVYEQQKELILHGERVVLATLGFDFNVHHPYKPLVEAIKRFKVAQNALAQVAWNFVNDGLRTSLCLQFKPHHIAAGAIFLAAKFLKVKLPSDGEKVWWQEFDVTPRQLEEVSNQMLELYEQNRAGPTPPSHGSEVDGSGGGTSNDQRPWGKTAAAMEEQPASSVNGYSLQAAVNKPGGSYVGRQSNQSEPQRNNLQNNSDGHGSIDSKTSNMWEHKEWDGAAKVNNHLDKSEEAGELNEVRTPWAGKEEKPAEGGLSDGRLKACIKGSSDAIQKIDKEKVKAALEKRKKNRAEDMVRRPDMLDDYDIIERELENGVEMVEFEKKQHKNTTPSKMYSAPQNQAEKEHSHGDVGEISFDGGDGNMNGYIEEGELSSFDITAPPGEYHSAMNNSRKRKADVSPVSRDGRSDYHQKREHNHKSYRQDPHQV